MADNRVEIDESAVAEMFTIWSPDNPVAAALDASADLVHAEAYARAPVSPRGSKYAPSGFLKSRIVKSGESHSDDGEIALYVGTRLNSDGGAFPYPYSFISNDKGWTWNRGGRSKRSATQYFLLEALEATPFVTYGEP